MSICGLRDFGWKDLGAPTSKRFRRQLSGAINFARFREERMPIYEELTQQREEVLAALRTAQTDRTALLADLDDARADDIGGDMILPGWGLHLVDMTVVMDDISTLIRRQIDAFL